MTTIERGTDLHVRRQIGQYCVFVLDRVIADTTIANTVAETTLYTKTVDHEDINGKVLRLTLGGTYLNNTGALSTPNMRVKFGSTTLINSAGSAFTANAAIRLWEVTIWLTSRSTSAQELKGHQWFTGAVGITTGNGASPAQAQSLIYENASTETTSGAGTKALTVTWQHDAASANLSIILKTAILERL